MTRTPAYELGEAWFVKLENTTPLAAQLQVSRLPNTDLSLGCVTAKATYRLDGDGPPALDTDDPFPIFDEDVETDLGLLPHDRFPRRDPAFEVILLGAAHAPNGEPVERMTVSLTVGDHRKDLVVTGDRQWLGRGDGATISAATPFARMPLTWDRAFGGTAEVLIDVESPMDLAHPLNPDGHGFDPTSQIAQLADYLKPPAGFPHTDYQRQLPNLEAPDERVQGWDDNPDEPRCWATVPLSSPMHLRRAADLTIEAEEPSALFDKLSQDPTFSPRLFHRAVDQWVLPGPPPPAALVVIEGVNSLKRNKFSLPELRVFADYLVGNDQGRRELSPQMMVLLPEQMRMYIVFRHLFLMAFVSTQTRAMRLRTERGWFVPPDKAEEGIGPKEQS